MDTTLGKRPLSDSFLLSASYQEELGSDILQLMPSLTVEANSTSSWGFLKSLGVSMDFEWEVAVKLLRQLSSSRAAPGLGSMRKLYQRIQSFCVLRSSVQSIVRTIFEHEPLISLSGSTKEQQDGDAESESDAESAQGDEGYWVRSSEVLWSGDPDVHCHKIFIGPYYKVCVSQPVIVRQQY